MRDRVTLPLRLGAPVRQQRDLLSSTALIGKRPSRPPRIAVRAADDASCGRRSISPDDVDACGCHNRTGVPGSTCAAAVALGPPSSAPRAPRRRVSTALPAFAARSDRDDGAAIEHVEGPRHLEARAIPRGWRSDDTACRVTEPRQVGRGSRDDGQPCAVGPDECQHTVEPSHQAESAFVDGAMMPSAQEKEVIESCRAAVGPML